MAEEQFIQATLQEKSVAEQYLKRTAGDAQKAITLFFEENPQDGCDGCGENLVGKRHKCTVCEDFELCEKCVSSQFVSEAHSPSHTTVEKTQARDRGWSFSKGQNRNPRGAFMTTRK